MKEKYKPYPEDNRYLVSRTGIVLSIYRKPLSPQRVTHGYLYVALRICGRKKYKSIHRLVAETWIGNPNKHNEINHKDGNKGNNHVENLEWCSHVENMTHAINNDLLNQKLNLMKAEEIRTKYLMGNPVISLAKKYGVSTVSIYNVINNDTWVSK